MAGDFEGVVFFAVVFFVVFLATFFVLEAVFWVGFLVALLTFLLVDFFVVLVDAAAVEVFFRVEVLEAAFLVVVAAVDLVDLVVFFVVFLTGFLVVFLETFLADFFDDAALDRVLALPAAGLDRPLREGAFFVVDFLAKLDRTPRSIDHGCLCNLPASRTYPCFVAGECPKTVGESG